MLLQLYAYCDYMPNVPSPFVDYQKENGTTTRFLAPLECKWKHPRNCMDRTLSSPPPQQEGREGGGGSRFWKTREIGWPFYSNGLSTLSSKQCTRGRGGTGKSAIIYWQKICEILYSIRWLLYVLNRDNNNPGAPTSEIINFDKIYTLCREGFIFLPCNN